MRSIQKHAFAAPDGRHGCLSNQRRWAATKAGRFLNLLREPLHPIPSLSMNAIKQFTSALRFPKPVKAAGTSAASTLHGLARQARRKASGFSLTRQPGTPARQETADVRLNGLNALKDLQDQHNRNTQAHDALYASSAAAVCQATETDVIDPANASAATPAPATPKQTVLVEPPATRVGGAADQRDAIVGAHAELGTALENAGVTSLRDDRAGKLTASLQEAAQAIASFNDVNIDAATGAGAHLEAVKLYAKSLNAAHGHAVVLRANIMSRGGNNPALDRLIDKLAAQKKAVAAHVDQLGA